VTLLPPLKQFISIKLPALKQPISSFKLNIHKLSIFNPQPSQSSGDSDSDLLLPTPQETLEDIGDRLRLLREQKYLSIEEIAAQTQIQPRLVQAIEQGQIELLPESVYVKGMVKRLGNRLGIDGVLLSQEVLEWNAKTIDRTQTQTFLQTGFHTQTGVPKNQGLPTKSVASVKPLHVYLGYTLAIIGVGAGISQLINNSTGAKRSSPNEAQGNRTAPIVARTATVSNTAIRTNQLPSVKIGIVAKTPTWAQIGVDGVTQFTGNLSAGAQLNLLATKQVTINTNNAGGLWFSRDLQPPQQLGKLGEKQSITIKMDKQSAPKPKQIVPPAP
jgi:cytoskeletal protein RodZ